MREAAIVGAGMTPFGRHPEKGIKDLVRGAVELALEDAGVEPGILEAAYVGSAAPGLMTGQEQIKAQVTLSAMGIDSIPMYNVENACASSSSALNLAWTAVSAGIFDCVLAVGFEKLYDENRLKSYMALGTAMDIEMGQKYMEDFQEKLGLTDKVFSDEAGAKKSVFMDMYAFYTRRYMEQYGLTQEHFAKIAVKSHKNGALNPNAHYRKEVTLDQVLNSGDVSFPLTRMMCSPVSDGSAAVIVCSKEKAAQIAKKPVWIEASVLGSGKLGYDMDDTLTRRVGLKAFKAAGITPQDVDVIEIHDATSPSEIIALIELGVCPPHEAPKWIDEGYMELDGKMPVNTSGGLASKGHPIGATGLAQVYEVVNQLRGTAGERQAQNNPKIGMTQNGGGILGIDGAAMAFHILKS
ncbi:Acetyl-CoA acetyltransferase [Desulfatibacillum alkenivorans DSM 16219]|jgi:acetyl-CoA acetyltransferase|uniref:Acetyl-CoA acetyltransferase n=1 Tax=Desulfatibacillum alkenivorans DSM 16219 TaxID=1121393 RepID=A0A1M6TF11_9BACT|nr:thiolase family protein [Desulfatibacillum alkenivorans]SHK55358.1 Acetyl-CoA acetyltransferase [Desulfatibacillum alkenivorans DSM 16219]